MILKRLCWAENQSMADGSLCLQAWLQWPRCTNKTATHTHGSGAYHPLRGSLTAGVVALAEHVPSEVIYILYMMYSSVFDIQKLEDSFSFLCLPKSDTKPETTVKAYQGRGRDFTLKKCINNFFVLTPVLALCSWWVMCCILCPLGDIQSHHKSQSLWRGDKASLLIGGVMNYYNYLLNILHRAHRGIVWGDQLLMWNFVTVMTNDIKTMFAVRSSGIWTMGCGF